MFVLVPAYFKLYLLSTVRNPPAFFFTIVFPVLMLFLTSHQWSTSIENKLTAFIIFLNYSVQTVSFMLLGMGVSTEKNSDWARYRYTLAVPISTMVLARILHTISLCFLNLIIISIAAIFILSVPVTLSQLLYLFVIALMGSIPMALMGMVIGYAAQAESSRSIFTLLNLLLLFGAFSFPSSGLFKYIREIIPTYQWRILSEKIINPNLSVTAPILCLAIYSIISAFLFKKIYFSHRN